VDKYEELREFVDNKKRNEDKTIERLKKRPLSFLT